MAHVNSAPSAAMTQALEHLRRGDTAEAEAVMQAHVQEVRQQHGDGSPAHQRVMNELGMILFNAGQEQRATEAFRAACAGPLPDDEQNLRDRLTHLMNLGWVLEITGHLDEAEASLRQGIDGRARCYGRRHAEYGIGLEPLARLLLKRGRIDEALTTIEETVQTFWKNGHSRVVTALAHRAEIRAVAGHEGSLLGDVNELPRRLIEELAVAIHSRYGRAEPLAYRRVLEELATLLRDRFGKAHPQTINTLKTRANLERDLGPRGDAVARIGAISCIIDSLESLDLASEVISAMQGLALAQSDYGRHDEALATYREAERRARQLGEPTIIAQVLRNFGLYLADRHLRDEAERLLFEAVEQARQSDHRDILGRSLVALGIFLQHGNRRDEAAPLLRQGLELLTPTDPDAMTARSHLSAVESGSSCGCGDPHHALVESLRALVLPHLPDGLVDELDFAPDENGLLQPNVRLTREPSEAEMEQLQRVISDAVEEFRRQLTEQR